MRLIWSDVLKLAVLLHNKIDVLVKTLQSKVDHDVSGLRNIQKRPHDISICMDSIFTVPLAGDRRRELEAVGSGSFPGVLSFYCLILGSHV